MTTVSVRMDENLKRDFDEICNELGLSMTTGHHHAGQEDDA